MLLPVLRQFLLFFCLAITASVVAQPFRDEIQAFQRLDSVNFPATGQVLFVGSSSFRLWKDVQAYFPDVPIINRGFGGACLTDMIYYEKQIITPYKPRKIVIYCGENDLAASDTVQAQQVLERFQQLFKAIRADYPKTPVVYVSIKPSISRQRLMPKMAEANRLIQQYLKKKRRTQFVDVYSLMLDKNGTPRPDIFVEDKLHMNREGYLIWQKALAPVISR